MAVNAEARVAIWVGATNPRLCSLPPPVNTNSQYHLPELNNIVPVSVVPLPAPPVKTRLPEPSVPVPPNLATAFNVAKLLVGESVSWLTAAVMLVEVAQLLALPEVSVPSALPVPNASLNPFVPYAAHGDAVLYVFGLQYPLASVAPKHVGASAEPSTKYTSDI